MSFDIYAAVTDRIIRQMEKGIIPWQKPWGGIEGGAYSGSTGKPYSLLNQMLLSRPGAYYTFNQIQKMGGNIRKGETSSLIVFWKQIPVKEQDSQTGEIKTTVVPMLRYYSVFHVDQCDGITAPATEPKPTQNSPEAESIVSEYLHRSGVELIQKISDEAYYSPSRDCVVLPMPDQFKSTAEYYSTLLHELAHSTGHQSRLNRLRATAHFGNESYSKEELVAEITAAALMNHTGLETKGTFQNSAAYIQSWLSALRNDKRLIVAASGAASKAFDYIVGITAQKQAGQTPPQKRSIIMARRKKPSVADTLFFWYGLIFELIIIICSMISDSPVSGTDVQNSKDMKPKQTPLKIK